MAASVERPAALKAAEGTEAGPPRFPADHVSSTFRGKYVVIHSLVERGWVYFVAEPSHDPEG